MCSFFKSNSYLKRFEGERAVLLNCGSACGTTCGLHAETELTSLLIAGSQALCASDRVFC